VDTRNAGRTESSKNSICFFYPPLPFHLPSSSISLHCSLPFSSHRAWAGQRGRGRAVHSIHALPSLRRRPVSASKNHFDRRGRGVRCECDRRLPSSSFLEQCGSGAWHSSTAPPQAKQSDFKVRAVPRNPNRSISFPFASPAFLLA